MYYKADSVHFREDWTTEVENLISLFSSWDKLLSFFRVWFEKFKGFASRFQCPFSSEVDFAFVSITSYEISCHSKLHCMIFCTKFKIRRKYVRCQIDVIAQSYYSNDFNNLVLVKVMENTFVEQIKNNGLISPWLYINFNTI